MHDRDAFAAVASTYEGWFATPLGRFVEQQERQALARMLSGIEPGAMLDIGAGTGHSAAWLVSGGHQVTAVEPSSAMRHEGVRRTAGLPIRWCAARAEHLPFADASFEGAVLCTTLEFVHQPVQALQEAVRVVRPGGWVTVGVLHALSPWVALYRARADHGAMPWVAARFFTPEDVEGLMGQVADGSASAVYLAPQAKAPFEEADRAGKLAGNQPALAILQWRKRT
jgi:ubiquinone/menaquinone biosynthesis C-methylase UbiE